MVTRLVHGQGVIIAQHSGDNAPATEGFSSSGAGQVGGVTNDLGYKAWATQWTVNSGIISTTAYSTPIENIATLDWILSVTVQVVATNGRTAGEFGAFVETGASSFFLGFDSDANGNQIVEVGNTDFTLSGGSTYNNYQLDYDARTETASLWINGTEDLSGIAGQFGSTSAYLVWGGEGQPAAGGTSQANWNLVSLEIVPEPSVLSLIFLGSGVFVYVRRTRKYA